MESPAIKTLRSDFNAKLTEAKSLQDKPDATPDEIKRAGELADEAEGIKTRIEGAIAASAKLDSLKNWDNAPANSLPQNGAASNPQNTFAGKTEFDLFTGEIMSEEGAGVLKTAQVKAIADPQYYNGFISYLRAGGKIEKVKDKDERKSLQEGVDSDGGYLVPPEIIAGILRREPTPVSILDEVRTITVSRDKAQMLRSVYDSDDLYSSAVRIYPTGEGQAAPTSGQPQFGTFSVDVHNFTAELQVTNQLLDDSDFGLAAHISEEFRTAARNFAADKIIRGSGVNEHFGILTRAGQAGKGPDIIKTGNASQITWEGLRKIKNAVPEQYDMNCKYIFNKRSTQDAIEALVDNDGRPLWPESQHSGLENGTPGRLQGYGYLREAFMPDVAANAFPLIFGDPRGYLRALRLGISIRPLTEIEARSGKTVFLATLREGGDVAEPWRLKVQKVAA